MLFTLIWAFLNLLFFQSFSILNTMSNLKVRKAIYGFIGLSNILPLVILAVFASQYMNQKYLAMIDNKKNQALNFLQEIEEEFLNEIERLPNKAQQIIKNNKNLFNKKKLSLQDAQKLKYNFNMKNMEFNIIANNATTFINNEVFVTKNKIINLNANNEIIKTKKLVDVMKKFGNCYLAFLNNGPISQKKLTELELLSDMIFQKTIEESLHFFVELSDQVLNFGIGTSSLPSFVYLLKKTNSNIFNYVCVFQLPLKDIAIRYLKNIKTSRLANPFGLKVILQEDSKLKKHHLFPFKKTRKLGQLMAKLKIYPPAKAVRVTLDGKKWIYTGYKSSIMHSIQLAAFYPVAEINHKLEQEKRDLIILFIANLFIVLVISYFFSKTLLIPIHHLKEGTEAINTRNFAYRLPDLGQDEFGKMAEIFNTAISDLEELSVAGVVQQNLFPTDKIPTGNFELFGKSEALADLGGDYLDYFDIDKDNFGVILGDVAGHGVGAALLMAMAKSTTINSADYYKKPVEFTDRLHKLIYNSKTRKQKKIMTFQYLMVNKNSNSLMFCNAGGCNPFIVNGPQNKVEEIQLPAPALGAFKRAKYKDRQLSFTSGDVMVLYTDGIVEARNKNNEEIGYELFKEILLRNYTTNPEQYYQKVLKEYHDWLGETDAEDDLTMIFLTMERIKPSAIKPGLK
jgi:methyl-accepting chemotaxis protein